MPTDFAPHSSHPRYSSKLFPPYRFILGENPHPTVDPHGHSFGKEEGPAQILTVENWKTNDDYLYAIDLYNYAYWWEAHEALEGLWMNFPRGVPESSLLQGIIKISAGFYKWRLMDARGVAYHYVGGTGHLKEAMAHANVCMGIDLNEYLKRLAEHFKAVLAEPDS